MGLQDVLTESSVIPVVVLEDHLLARPLGEALVSGGVPIAEVTFRTAAAVKSIEEMAQLDGIVVGAGTVLSSAQVDAAVDAGAQFIVSPGLSRTVVERALEREVTVFPGVATPTEIMAAIALGLDTVKFFPAHLYGGPAGIKALSGPFPELKFVPTGGVNLENMADYLALPNVSAVGGTWMVKAELLKNREFDKVAQLAREAAEGAAQMRKGR